MGREDNEGRLADLIERLRGKPPTNSTLDRYEAAEAIDLLQRKLKCAEELWEQQQDLALEYLADIEKAKDWIAEQDKEIHDLKVELAKWVQFWRDKDNKALQDRIAELEAALKPFVDGVEIYEASPPFVEYCITSDTCDDRRNARKALEKGDE